MTKNGSNRRHLVVSGRARPPRPARARSRRTTSGFTMVELLVVVVVLAIALTMMSGTMQSASRLGPLQRERARAAEAAREMLELLRIEPYHRLFVLYNDEPADDPAGEGTASGPHFAVEGLTVPENDQDGMCGRVRFPGDSGAELREDAVDTVLGLPRDLNADGEIGEVDVSDSYTILPVEVIVEWESGGMVHSMRIQTMFSEPDA
jgi:prepilin-type N-terminal cleavage/methylation domain-containing protein